MFLSLPQYAIRVVHLSREIVLDLAFIFDYAFMTPFKSNLCLTARCNTWNSNKIKKKWNFFKKENDILRIKVGGRKHKHF